MMDNRLCEVLAQKPELLREFPKWMITGEALDEFSSIEPHAVVEVSGKGSVAAGIKASRDRRLKAALLSIAYTGTEYGQWEAVFRNAGALSGLLESESVKAFGPVVVGSPSLWRELCARRMAGINRSLGYYTPCVGCHLYLHAVRLPLLRRTGTGLLVSGERDYHDGKVKVEQAGTALEAYAAFMLKFGAELVFPIRHSGSLREIDSITGGKGESLSGATECVMRGNYLDDSGAAVFDEATLSRLAYEHLVPIANEAMKRLL